MLGSVKAFPEDPAEQRHCPEAASTPTEQEEGEERDLCTSPSIQLRWS